MPLEPPLNIAVVIPTLNEEAALPALAAGLEAGGLSGAWTWVADGGSRDRTWGLAGRLGLRRLRARRGRGSQMAAGARAALKRGADLLLFLHADSAVFPGTAAALREAFADPNLAYACFRQRVSSPKGYFRMMEWMVNRRSRLSALPYGDLGLAVRAGHYRWCGGFPDWPLFEDVALAQKLKACGRFRLLDLPLGTSARRWEQGGPALVTLRNWGIMSLYLLGARPSFLVRFYPPNAPAGPEAKK